MVQYAAWSAAARGAVPSKARAEDFYTDQWAQNVFKNYLANLTSRVNSFTGVPYRCSQRIPYLTESWRSALHELKHAIRSPGGWPLGLYPLWLTAPWELALRELHLPAQCFVMSHHADSVAGSGVKGMRTLRRDDPTIMAWSLANEPRCQGDYSGATLQVPIFVSIVADVSEVPAMQRKWHLASCVQTYVCHHTASNVDLCAPHIIREQSSVDTHVDLAISAQGWLDDTAESLKSIDPNHLVTYDSEGFLGSSTPGRPTQKGRPTIP